MPHRSVDAVTVLALCLGTTAAFAQATPCTVEIREYERYDKRSGPCLVDEPTNTIVVLDLEYWGKRGRKLLVPRTAEGRKPAAFISISPTDVRANDVAHAMNYRIEVLTRKGAYRFQGLTPTRTYEADVPPLAWQRQRPGEPMDTTGSLTTAQMLAEFRALTPTGPALDPAVVEQVLTRRQSLADRTPTLAGIHADISAPRKPVDSPALSALINAALKSGR